VDRLRDTVNHQEEELERLHKDLKERESKEQEQLSESEKYEQGVLDELNQEYHATLQLLKAGPARLTSRTTWYVKPCMETHFLLLFNQITVCIFLIHIHLIFRGSFSGSTPQINDLLL